MELVCSWKLSVNWKSGRILLIFFPSFFSLFLFSIEFLAQKTRQENAEYISMWKKIGTISCEKNWKITIPDLLFGGTFSLCRITALPKVNTSCEVFNLPRDKVFKKGIVVIFYVLDWKFIYTSGIIVFAFMNIKFVWAKDIKRVFILTR